MTIESSGGSLTVLNILEDLVKIQSVNPHYGDGAAGEGGVADYVARRLGGLPGVTVTRQPVLPGRDNVIVELRVGKPDRALLFEAHMDTVSLGSMEDPLTPVYRDGRLYARGACDTKGSLAGMIHAIEACARRPDLAGGDLVLLAAVDEEHAYRGILAFLELGMPLAGAVIGEPTELGIVAASKGCARFAVHTHGRAAHTSVPHEGDSAIYQMMQVLRFIRERVEPQLALKRDPRVGSPTIAVGTIRGGKQINIVPESCTIEVDRRLIPGELPDAVLAEFERELHAYAAGECGGALKVSVERLLLDWALDTPWDAAVVTAARRAAAALGLPGEVLGVPYGSDASKLAHFQGVPSIVYGPGSIAQAHSREEWVSVAQVEQAAGFYTQLAQTFGRGW